MALSPLVLLTLTSGHLVSIEQVRRRVLELRSILPGRTEWVQAIIKSTGAEHERTTIESCLPCHSVYFLAALHIANLRQIDYIAAGYTRYQSEWLEQSPLAVDWLRKVIGNFGKKLLLPVQDLASKDEAKSTLRLLGLSEDALEQKCLRQRFNSANVEADLARAEVDLWGRNLERLLALGGGLDFVEFKGALTLDEVTR
jgi:hypothetical protein